MDGNCWQIIIYKCVNMQMQLQAHKANNNNPIVEQPNAYDHLCNVSHICGVEKNIFYV